MTYHVRSLPTTRSLNNLFNQISDIEALVNNPGLADGDWVWLGNNPLSETSVNTYIPQLEARGCECPLLELGRWNQDDKIGNVGGVSPYRVRNN